MMYVLVPCKNESNIHIMMDEYNQTTVGKKIKIIYIRKEILQMLLFSTSLPYIKLVYEIMKKHQLLRETVTMYRFLASLIGWGIVAQKIADG